jgi:O-antigen/teichoic acid export membrane protein
MGKGEKVIGNFIWRLLERFGAQGVTLIVSIVLARLLDPEVYGTVAIVTVLTSLLHVFIDSGLGTALIQKKNADDLDFSSVFFFNMAICILLYLGLFFSAPLVAAFYGISELTAIVRVLGITLIISGVKNVQQAYVSRNMLFKKFFFATLGGTIGAAIVGITMAYLGFGVWALIGQHLFNATVDTLILWGTVKWRPKKIFSFQRLKSLLGFGSKILGISLTNTIYEDIRQLLIGKLYLTSDLAFYNKAKQFPSLFNTNINASIDSILLPVMSREQGDLGAVKAITRRSIKTSTYIMTPLLVGLAMCGESFISFLLTDIAARAYPPSESVFTPPA